MNKIPLHLYKSLIVFADSASLSEAALKLEITQPGLTKQLQNLESLLPHKIFTQEGKRKKLTSYGEALAHQIKNKIEGLENIIEQTSQQFNTPEESTVRIMGRIGVLSRFFSKLNFPGCLIFEDASNDATIKGILNRSADLGITFFKQDSLELIAQPLYKEKFKLVISKKLLQKKPETIKKTFEQIRHLPCLTYKQQDEIFDTILTHFNLKSSDLKIKRTLANFDGLLAMTENKIGWTLIPRQFYVDMNNNWVVDIPSSIHPDRQFYLYYRKELRSLPWLKLLVDEIKNCFENA